MKSALRVLALALLLTLLCSASVLAADKGLTISYIGDAVLTQGKTAKVLSTKFNAVSDGTVTYSLTDTVKKTVIYTETKTGVKTGQEIQWSVPYYDEGMSASKPVKEIRASFLLDGKTYTYNLYYNYTAENGGTVTVEKAAWYPKNTACSFGPAFRDMRPGLTDKWYTFTPIDRTRQGRQTFEYVASNMYVIGQVYVDVNGDTVRVTYHNYYADQSGNTQTLTEYFTFFPDLKSVTNVDPETMDDLGFHFGQDISIAEDLEGDTNVLLFVRNQVTYCNYVNNTHKLTRFWPNLPERKALRQQMQAIMDP